MSFSDISEIPCLRVCSFQEQFKWKFNFDSSSDFQPSLAVNNSESDSTVAHRSLECRKVSSQEESIKKIIANIKITLAHDLKKLSQLQY